MVGAVAPDLPSTPLALGQAVTSVLDPDTRPVDVYAVRLAAGQTLRVDMSADAGVSVFLADPGAAPSGGDLGALRGTTLCLDKTACQKAAPIAVAGTYGVILAANSRPTQYTLQATAQ